MSTSEEPRGVWIQGEYREFDTSRQIWGWLAGHLLAGCLVSTSLAAPWTWLRLVLLLGGLAATALVLVAPFLA